MPWYRTLSANQWKTLFASNLGWIFDGYETFALILTVGVALRQLLDPSHGILPALLTLWLRRNIEESKMWERSNDVRQAATGQQGSGAGVQDLHGFGVSADPDTIPVDRGFAAAAVLCLPQCSFLERAIFVDADMAG